MMLSAWETKFKSLSWSSVHVTKPLWVLTLSRSQILIKVVRECVWMDYKHLPVTFSVADRPVCVLVFLKALQVRKSVGPVCVASAVSCLFVGGGHCYGNHWGGVFTGRPLKKWECVGYNTCLQQLYELSLDEGHLNFRSCVCPCVGWRRADFLSVFSVCTENKCKWAAVSATETGWRSHVVYELLFL